jgi:hypothetical protein
MKVHLKTLKKIKDNSVGRERLPKETFTVTPERFKEMQQTLGRDFNRFFLLVKMEAEKKVIEPVTETKKRQPRKKKTDEKD